MKAIVLLACIFVTFAREYQQFGAWPRSFQDKMDNCLWFPRSTISQDIADIPKFAFNSTWKFGQICDLPLTFPFRCDWGWFVNTIKGCIYQSNIPYWRRIAFKNILDKMPMANCIGREECRCCRHPFHPNKEGTECVENPCPAFNKPNNWSECLWVPESNFFNQFKGHCELEEYERRVAVVVPPPAFIPDKCGMCTFRIRCRKRDRTNGCIHVEMDKKVCGAKDCPGCADVCTIPYTNGTNCNWIHFHHTLFVTKIHKLAIHSEMPSLTKDLPYGHCKNINGQCKCCCHPYQPNANGTKCILFDTDKTCFFDRIN